MWPLPQHNMNIQMRNGDDDFGTTFTILRTTTFREIDNYTLFVWVIYGQKTRNNLSPNVKYLKWILFHKNYRFDFDVQFKEMMIGSYGYQLSNYSFIQECCQTVLCFFAQHMYMLIQIKNKELDCLQTINHPIKNVNDHCFRICITGRMLIYFPCWI